HRTLSSVYVTAVSTVSQFVTDWFGESREKIQIAELPDVASVPFESANLLLVPPRESNAKQAELSAVHHLTRSAFTSPRPWMQEGLTHFAQALYREQQDGRPSAIEFMQAHQDIMQVAERERTDEVKSSLVNTTEESLYRGKAMYVWWMLRDLVGESNL